MLVLLLIQIDHQFWQEIDSRKNNLSYKKEKIMPKYFLDQFTLVVTAAMPDDAIIMASITEQNKGFTIEENIEHGFIVMAKIKPSDKPVSGVIWKEDSQKHL